MTDVRHSISLDTRTIFSPVRGIHVLIPVWTYVRTQTQTRIYLNLPTVILEELDLSRIYSFVKLGKEKRKKNEWKNEEKVRMKNKNLDRWELNDIEVM